jgi:hypothetical protein
MVTAERSGSSLSSALVRDNSVCGISSVRAARKVFRELIYAQVGCSPTATVNIALPCTMIWIAGMPRSLVPLSPWLPQRLTSPVGSGTRAEDSNITIGKIP